MRAGAVINLGMRRHLMPKIDERGSETHTKQKKTQIDGGRKLMSFGGIYFFKKKKLE
jgi:hypothetical protein